MACRLAGWAVYLNIECAVVAYIFYELEIEFRRRESVDVVNQFSRRYKGCVTSTEFLQVSV